MVVAERACMSRSWFVGISPEFHRVPVHPSLLLSDLFLYFPCSVLLQGPEICRPQIPRLPRHRVSIWVQPWGGGGGAVLARDCWAEEWEKQGISPLFSATGSRASSRCVYFMAAALARQVSKVPASAGWTWSSDSGNTLSSYCSCSLAVLNP